MAINSTPPEPDLPNIRKSLRTRPLWRLFGWGSAASIALAAVALTSQTDDGSKRLQLALAFASEQAPVVFKIPPRAPETTAEAEIKRLAAQLRELTADRDRLTARIATLEHNLEDMTGSIKQQSEQLAAARFAANTPAPSAPATTPARVIAGPPSATALLALTPLAMPAVGETAASWPAAPTKTEAEEAAAQPKAAEAATELAPPPPAIAEFSIDLGGANSIDALRIHWAALKANYGPLLAGLHPLAAQHPKRPAGITYRLVAGPLPNADEAARLFARFPVIRSAATRPSSRARNWPRIDCLRAGAPA